MSSSAAGGAIVRKVSMQGKRKRAAVQRAVPRSLATRGTPNGVHEFKRTVWTELNISNGGLQIPSGGTFQPEFAMRFGLSTLTMVGAGTSTSTVPGYAELSALFDQIKLDKVRVKFMFRNSAESGVQNVTTNSSVQIGTAIDYNSDQPISSAAIREYSNFKYANLSADAREHTVSFSPKFAQQITYTGGVGNNSTRAMTGYVQSNIDVTHYGLLGYASGPTPASPGVLWIAVDYYFSCKNVK